MIGFQEIRPNNIIYFSGYDLSKRRLSDNVPYDSANRGIGTKNEDYVIMNLSKGRAIKTRIPKNSYITINKDISDRFRVALYKIEPQPNMKPDKFICDDNTLTNISFYTEDCNWLYAFYTISDETINIKITVTNTLDYNNLLRENNIDIFDKINCDNLFDKELIQKGVWLGPSNEKYQFRHVETTTANRSYIFPLIKGEIYSIEKNLTDRFRVGLFADYPAGFDGTLNTMYDSCPQKIVVDDETQTACTFNSENYRYCVVTYTISGQDIDMVITNSSNTKYLLKKCYIKDYLPVIPQPEIFKTDGGYVLENDINKDNNLWKMWNARLAFGMNTSAAKVPTYNKGQAYFDGTVITHNSGNMNSNRWGFHVYEAYAKDNYSRMTMLLDKHNSELNKKSLEFYYYTGSSHYASAYGNTKIGSDVAYHSFLFDRDRLTAYGEIICEYPITLARISIKNDLITDYDTVSKADNAYEPENYYENHIKCLKYIMLKGAKNGAMFYDTDRDKAVIKINGKWCDIVTSNTPENAYSIIE